MRDKNIHIVGLIVTVAILFCLSLYKSCEIEDLTAENRRLKQDLVNCPADTLVIIRGVDTLIADKDKLYLILPK